MIHTLKTWPEYYDPIAKGFKKFDVRRNDRIFKAGDTLYLQEWDPKTETYTGRYCTVVVTYIMQGLFGIPRHLCIMSIELIEGRE